MGLKSFPSTRILLALSTCLAMLCPSYADDGIPPIVEGEAPAATDSTSAPQPTKADEPKKNEEATQTSSATTGSAEAKKENETPSKESHPVERTAVQSEHKRPVQEERRPATTAPHQQETQAAAPPTKLFGRIEELSAGAGARFPLKMQAMVPIRDPSLDGRDVKLAGKTNIQQAYPIDFRGQWSGELTVWDARFDPSYFQFDRAEAEKESQLLKRGTKGNLTANFYQSIKGIELQPCEAVFQGTDSFSDQLKMMGGSSGANAGAGQMGQLGALLGGGGNSSAFSNMRIPIVFSLHFGAPLESGSRGVSGNTLQSTLMKNTLRQLAKGVLEQQVVTKDSDTNTTTGKSQNGYSESVLRFTHMNNNQIYLQCAYVYYRNDGRFQAKYILYGTLNKSNGAQPNAMTPYASGGGSNPFGGLVPGAGGGANPFGGMMQGGSGGSGGSGGAGAIQQQMQQMQKMLQQMNGGH